MRGRFIPILRTISPQTIFHLPQFTHPSSTFPQSCYIRSYGTQRSIHRQWQQDNSVVWWKRRLKKRGCASGCRKASPSSIRFIPFATEYGNGNRQGSMCGKDGWRRRISTAGGGIVWKSEVQGFKKTKASKRMKVFPWISSPTMTSVSYFTFYIDVKISQSQLELQLMK